MSALFVAASSQRLTNTASLVTAPKLTVGMWVNLRAVDTVARTLFCLSDPTDLNDEYLALRMDATEALLIEAGTALGGVTNAAGSTLTAGTWCFAICRFISSTSRRIDSISASGAQVGAQDTQPQNVSLRTTITLGALNLNTSGLTDFWDGLIGEFWYTATDVQPDGAVMQASLLRQLAYGGPFSVPSIADDVLEYRSFRTSLLAGDPGDVFFQNKPQAWTQTNSPTVSRHPPLPTLYVKPGQVKRPLVI